MEEQKILEGIVNFGNTETVQIMKPRIDIFALSSDDSYEEVLDKLQFVIGTATSAVNQPPPSEGAGAQPGAEESALPGVGAAQPGAETPAPPAV